MILHIFPRNKFENDYISAINRLFKPADHLFFVHGYNEGYEFPKLTYENVIYGRPTIKHKNFVKAYMKADKIIMHSMFLDWKMLLSLNILDLLYRKPIVWCIWGGDLYNAYWDENRVKYRIKHCLRIFLRKRLISRVKYAAVSVDTDYENLRKWYKTDAQKFFSTCYYDFMIPSNIATRNDDGKINIMVGHSASGDCRHIEIFRLLEKYRGKIRVYSPLSYAGDATQIIKAGNETFGSDFIPMTEYMNSEDYTKFLVSMDAAIFNNTRQQGNGNIARLLYLGKKIFISHENPLYKTYKKYGACFYFFPEEFSDETLFTPFNDEQKKACHDAIENIYSDESFRKNCEAIFNA